MDVLEYFVSALTLLYKNLPPSLHHTLDVTQLQTCTSSGSLSLAPSSLQKMLRTTSHSLILDLKYYYLNWTQQSTSPALGCRKFCVILILSTHRSIEHCCNISTSFHQTCRTRFTIMGPSVAHNTQRPSAYRTLTKGKLTFVSLRIGDTTTLPPQKTTLITVLGRRHSSPDQPGSSAHIKSLLGLHKVQVHRREALSTNQTSTLSYALALPA